MNVLAGLAYLYGSLLFPERDFNTGSSFECKEGNLSEYDQSLKWLGCVRRMNKLISCRNVYRLSLLYSFLKVLEKAILEALDNFVIITNVRNIDCVIVN